MRKAKYIYYNYLNNAFSIIWLFPNNEVIKAQLKSNSSFYSDFEKCKSSGIISESLSGSYTLEDSKLSFTVSEDLEVISVEAIFERAFEIYKADFTTKSNLTFRFKRSKEYRLIADSRGLESFGQTINYILYKESGLGLLNSKYNSVIKQIRFFNHDDIYPVVLLPINMHSAIFNEVSDQEAFDYLKIKPPILQLKPLPSKPKNFIYKNYLYPSLHWKDSGIFWIPFCLFANIFLGFNHDMSELVVFILQLLITITALYYSFSITRSWKQNKILISAKKYGALLNEYKEQLDKTNEENEEIQNEYDVLFKEFNEKFYSKINEAKSILYGKPKLTTSTSLIVEKQKISYKRGGSELLFLDALYNRFGDNIKVDSVLSGCSFKPDFIIISEEFNLHFDVEIDEPYTIVSDETNCIEAGTPIHYLDSPDDERNDFFLNNNWVVIRFSERQIKREANYCVDLIENVIEAIESKHKTYGLAVTPMKRWSYEEARIMYLNKERSKD